MSDRKWHVIEALIIAAVLIALIVIAVVYYLGTGAYPGQINESDLKKAYTVYISKGSSSDIWLVSDENVKDEIADLCMDITMWCEGSETQVQTDGGDLPVIYISGKNTGYRIELGGNSTSGAGPDGPVIHFWSIDLVSVNGEDQKLDKIIGTDDRDLYNTLNGDGHSDGWWSTMPEEDYEALLGILDSISGANSEIYISAEG